jgi:tetratricopeptide (TPR) repeat protein
MIVKNEAHGIVATLESFKPFIDHWTILDTGSTDNTQGIIRDKLSGLPGTLYEEPFVDFATSRNRALELHGKATTFVIMPDSDDQLVKGAALRAFLTQQSANTDAQPAYLVNLKRGTLSYYLPIVLRTDASWRYHGVVHEYIGPTTGDGFATVKIPGVQVVQDHQPLSAEASRKRWERDLVLLEDELARKPKDPRTLFYLAQTNECLGKPATALTLYEQRIALGGWAEETFETYLRRAKIFQALGRPWAEVQQAYLDAFKFAPKRAEPLFKIAEYWYCQDAHHLAYLFAGRASELPRPDATLFVDEEVYTWKCADIAAISGYYIDDELAKVNGRRYAEKCVRAKPDDERMRANWAFYTPTAAEMFPGYQAKPIDFTPEDPWSPYNPSIYFDPNPKGRTKSGPIPGRWRCIVRTSNYKIINGNYITPDNNIIHTRNFMLDLDDKLNVVKTTEMIDKTGTPRSDYPCHGFEDCRLFRHEGKLVFTATVCDFDLERAYEGPREIVLGELDDNYAIVRATLQRGPWSVRAQKNWMPTNDGRIIYAVAPGGKRASTVFRLEGQHVTMPAGTAVSQGRLRGGSHAVKVPGGWLCIVHDVAWPGGGRMYLHRFALLTEDLALVSLTDPFVFQTRSVEFCAGLAFDGKRLVASFGVEDQHALLGIFDLDVVLGQLRSDYQI